MSDGVAGMGGDLGFEPRKIVVHSLGLFSRRHLAGGVERDREAAARAVGTKEVEDGRPGQGREIGPDREHLMISIEKMDCATIGPSPRNVAREVHNLA